MSELEEACEITCPHCWERITVFVDLSAGGQSYYEDCSVCCRPIAIAFETADGELASLSVEAAG